MKVEFVSFLSSLLDLDQHPHSPYPPHFLHPLERQVLLYEGNTPLFQAPY